MKQIIYEMLTEKTGTHICDSGSIYGRHFERNSKKTLEDFENEPYEKYDFDGEYIERTVSVFHHLVNMDLSIDHICEKFNHINTSSNNWNADAEVYGVSEEAWGWLNELYVVNVDRTFNTYNGNSDLSQVLQGSNLEINGKNYFLVQIHNGCDVRSGYTDARLFRMNSKGDCVAEYKSTDEIYEDLRDGYITEIEGWSINDVKYKLEL